MRNITGLCTVLLIAVCASAQQPKIQQQAITLKRVIELNHIQPRAVDDRFSEDLFNDVINAADPDKSFLTRADIEQLSVYKNQLDDELTGKGWNFLPMLNSIFSQRSALLKTWIREGLSRDLEFNSTQEFIAHTKKSAFEADNEALKKYWQLFMKAAMLEQLMELAAEDTTKKISSKEIISKQAGIRQELLQNREKSYREKISNSELSSFLEKKYLECLSGCFDPHTHYFSPKDYQSFEADLSGGKIIYGFTVGANEKNEIVIRKLAPGSPAWKCGELHRDDVLLAIQYGDNMEIELKNETVAEVNTLVDAANGEKIVITVRKKDGAIKKVTLTSEKVNTDEGLVKSFILEKGKKIGYMALPDFYEGNGETTKGCASDVASEIIRLKKENIDGLILDLRYNGGGSMQEAIEMAGIFIDDGPLFQIKTREEKIKTAKDVNRGTIFDGPLLLLVNGASASASEILSGILQDYHRALIVGGRTFGKSTGQLVLPVDTTGKYDHPGSNMIPEFGYVKITMIKLYRLPGNTAQHSGVIPDIVLPDPIEAYDIHESGLPHSLMPDAVAANAYYRPLAAVDAALLKTKAEQRQGASERFKKLKLQITGKISEQNTPAKIPLKWELYEKYYRDQLKKEIAENKEPGPLPNTFNVDLTSFEKERIKINPDLLETRNDWKKQLQQSLYINEAFQILTDKINK